MASHEARDPLRKSTCLDIPAGPVSPQEPPPTAMAAPELCLSTGNLPPRLYFRYHRRRWATFLARHLPEEFSPTDHPDLGGGPPPNTEPSPPPPGPPTTPPGTPPPGLRLRPPRPPAPPPPGPPTTPPGTPPPPGPPLRPRRGRRLHSERRHASPPPPASVPEPGTVGLLAAGLLSPAGSRSCFPGSAKNAKPEISEGSYFCEMYFCVEVSPSCAASNCGLWERGRAFRSSARWPCRFHQSGRGERDHARSRAAERHAKQSRHARQREHFGKPGDQRLTRVLMQAVLHRVPQQIVAAVFERGDE